MIAPPAIDLREQLARIDAKLADIHAQQRAHHLRPWQVAGTVFTGGAALVASGAALLKLAGG